jgi:cytosine/creatinine deaminase
MLLTNVRLSDGTETRVRLSGERIAAVEPDLVPDADDELIDLEGRLLVPAFAEPHAHLDKAFLAERITNATGDLLGAITAMGANRHLLDVADITERAERAARLLAANGCSVIRTHADTTPDHGLKSVESLIDVRRRVADVVELQIVALTGWPVTGATGANTRALLRDALEMGADIVGGCPHLDDRPHEANEVLLALAADFGRPVDLHTDETLDPGMLSLADLARRVRDHGFEHPVTASHCVSLGVQRPDVQDRVARSVAEAGIGIVALPQTNLFLQGRDHPSAMPRGVTAVAALRRAGVVVCAGADNLQDPFNPLGRGDPLETAGLMIATCHVLPDEAMDMIGRAAHHTLGVEVPEVRAGSLADLVALPADTAREAIAFGPPGRLVWHRGRLVTATPTPR